MKKRLVLTFVLAGVVSTTAQAQFLPHARFTDAKTGYEVRTRMVGSRMILTGVHPTTGQTFRLVASPSGKVKGTFNDRPVEFSLKDDMKSLTELASR